jgi:hypothetical protein
MAFTQQTFLGASIVSFRGSLGWGDNPSTLTVSLVEDPANGDSFSVPGVGVPVLFAYSDWTFGGIIQNWKKDYSPGGHPVYEVILVDPREILGGVQLILSGYSDTTYGVPNLVNVFGYHENQFGFGSAEVNDSGIPWQKVRDAVVVLTALGSSSSYGGPISLGGYVYSVNLAGLPSLPSYYRVPAQSMSLMEYIKFVCDAANYDFFFTCTPTGGGGYITLVTINRNIEPISGAIDQYISSVGGSVSKNAGYELRNEITSKFLTGGPVSEMYIQANIAAAGGEDEDFDTNPEENSVWPYWGLDYEGNVIIGENNGAYHQFNIPTKGINVYGVGDYYPTDVAELMAAYEGYDSWLAFLALYNNNKYVNEDFAFYVDSDSASDFDTDILRDPLTDVSLHNAALQNITYHHQNKLNPHYGKSSRFKSSSLIAHEFAIKIMGMDTSIAQKIGPEDFAPFDSKNLSSIAKVKLPNAIENEQDNLQALFQFISSYARSYYGQQFMIRMPFIESARDSESNNITISRQPVAAGFIDEDQWETAITNNYLPGNIDRMLDQDYKIKAYVRFNDITDLDLSNIDESNLIISDDGKSAFILCDISQQIVYLDKETQYSPRVIVTLPGPVFPMVGPYQYSMFGVLTQFMCGEFCNPSRPGGPLTKAQASSAIAKIFSSVSATNLNFAIAPLYIVPDIFVVPLQSNIARYGPWYATGANGQLDLEIDETLVPWAFGGYDEMNQAAEAKVTSAISRYQTHEAGSIQFPGVPTIQMGSALVSSGPYVTDINVSIGTDGATTTYNMGTWTPQPFRFRKAQSEYVQRVNKKQQELRQQFRTYIRATDNNSTIIANRMTSTIRSILKSAREKKSSPHTAIVGNIIQLDDNTYKHTIAIDTDYGFVSSIGGEGKNAGASLDTIFVPFSLSTLASGMPHIENPSPSAVGITGDSFNPFGGNAQFGSIFYNDIIAPRTYASGYELYPDKYLHGNAIALRSPLMLAGWGYDASGNLMPSGIDYSDIHTRQDMWKVGPLDVRWDDDRKVWAAGISSSSGFGSPASGYVEIATEPLQVITSLSCVSGNFEVGYGTVYTVSSGTYNIIFS